MDGYLDLAAVSGSIKPRNLGLLPKPGQLTLSVTPGVTLNHTHQFVSRTGISLKKELTISNRFKRLCASRNASCQKLPNFFDKPRLEHPFDTLVNAPVQLVPRRIQADRADTVSREGLPWMLFQVFRQRLSSLQTDFQGANDLWFIAHRDATRRRRIQPLQQTMQVLASFLIRNPFEPVSPV
jgi:hypothetical protein